MSSLTLQALRTFGKKGNIMLQYKKIKDCDPKVCARVCTLWHRQTRRCLLADDGHKYCVHTEVRKQELLAGEY